MSLAQPGRTQTVLTQAVVESVSNQVRVVSQSQSPRSARVSEVIRPGDAIATAASSRADLRFNDQSLARLGAQSIFRFNPGTRNIDLSQGTALVLIRPGQGGTTIRTPNGAAGVRGSALVVRYDPATDTTLVAALTNSGIVVFNQDGLETLPIAAGEMAVFIENQPAKVYKFDLDTFYATSPLVAGLDLNNLEASDSSDGLDSDGLDSDGLDSDGLDEVREETTEALDSQTPVDADDPETLVNPEFISMTELEDNAELTDLAISVVDVDINDLDDADLVETLADSREELDVWSVVVGGEMRQQQILIETMMTGGVFPGGGATGGVFPGGGATGGVFPGGGATGGVFPGGGATGGVFPGGGAFPGGGGNP
ncbi:FecR domain-containing protein [Spirulina subsalsa FACHB-351]|uniref:FecR domain-containing protein n=1 Tax=Spirulina subsalsa FACHB-351 TaxID=234711 RepID=A0ABT3L5B3_9CYAN|nr:FecR domain-containing protein [Spirulina subsalsa]MCW6036701.1 FecR domain-containing protein [Spirulina subsalsa FACHB-351]